MHFSVMNERYESVVPKILAAADGARYSAFFLEPGPGITREQYELFLRIAMLGILERSHLACITLLARSHRWMKACGSALRESNSMAFAASLRGLVESAADGFDVMQYLPATLFRDFRHIYSVLYAEKFVPIVMEELEDRLIHYAFASKQKKGGSPPPHHTAKSNADYIERLETWGVPGLKGLYAKLCAITHPAAESVNCFISQTARDMRFEAQKDALIIQTLLTKHEECIENVCQFSFNQALIALAFLHRLCPEWAAPADETVSPLGKTAQRLKNIDEFLAEQDEVSRKRAYAQIKLSMTMGVQ